MTSILIENFKCSAASKPSKPSKLGRLAQSNAGSEKNDVFCQNANFEMYSVSKLICSSSKNQAGRMTGRSLYHWYPMKNRQ